MILSILYKSTTVDLKSGDLLLLMTDGITEPRNAEGVMHEESGWLNEVLSNIPADMPIEEAVDTIINNDANTSRHFAHTPNGFRHC
jgi:serine phosphatase RsbU (regulator of sigma subunit)